jgi:hypothetical protein
MTDFATTSDVVSALAAAGNSGAGGRFNIYKTSLTAVASNWYSGWQEGGAPAAGATPGAWVNPTYATLGAYNPNYVNPGSATCRLLWGSIAQTSQGQGKWLVDRLGHMGGLNGTVTTAQSTGAAMSSPVSDGRCSSDYSDVEWYLEWYSATGSTGVTATCAVTYNDGSTGNCTVTVAANTPAYRMLPIQPPAGTVGKWIKTVDTVTLSASTGTAGNFGVTAIKRLASFASIAANYADIRDFAALDMPKVGANACINAVYWTTTTSTGTSVGSFAIGAK